MADQTNSQPMTFPVCPVCFAKMVVRGMLPITYPTGRQDVNYTFSCDGCRIQCRQLGSVADVKNLSLLQRTRDPTPNTHQRDLKRGFG